MEGCKYGLKCEGCEKTIFSLIKKRAKYPIKNRSKKAWSIFYNKEHEAYREQKKKVARHTVIFLLIKKINKLRKKFKIVMKYLLINYVNKNESYFYQYLTIKIINLDYTN